MRRILYLLYVASTIGNGPGFTKDKLQKHKCYKHINLLCNCKINEAEKILTGN